LTAPDPNRFVTVPDSQTERALLLAESAIVELHGLQEVLRAGLKDTARRHALVELRLIDSQLARISEDLYKIEQATP
jgi:hypothetical protein